MLNSLLRKFKISRKNPSNSIKIGESSDMLFASLENKLNDRERSDLRNSSLKILQQTLPHQFPANTKNSNTGLVIGKIQSGKTMSFTSVLALAQDNGYKIVVLISGRTNLLLKQTKDRLKVDFQNDRNIKIKSIDAKTNVATLVNTISKPFENNKRSKLNILPILKHQLSINKVSELLSDKNLQRHLQQNTVLIIDDEADQASLNTFAKSNAKNNQNKASAIFSSIRRLRSVCPNHSYIQYTATPQANLLIDTFSLLSPDWHVLLTPGDSYTGGNEFFNDVSNNPVLYGEIPVEGDYPPETKNLTSPPSSYIDAIIEFLMLSALMSGRIKGTKKYNSKGSMLVHPTYIVNETKTNTVGIKKFESWCINIKDDLENFIDIGDYTYFESTYKKLQNDFENTSIFNQFPSIEDIMIDIEDNVIDEIRISRVTGNMLDKEEGYPWDEYDYHILLGGALLDRGFTVENLIMTYMPRDSKSKNQSDTIEQRCRFYGYRKKYLNFCRVYLTKGMIQDYQSYNEFENHLHKLLANQSLSEFYESGSRILLEKSLIATNMNRISDKLINTQLRKWQYFELQEYSVDDNNAIIQKYINYLTRFFTDLKPKNPNHKQDNYEHRACLRPLVEINDLLVNFSTDNFNDNIKKASFISYFELLQEINGVENIWVIEMAPKAKRQRTITLDTKNGYNVFEMSSLQAGDAQFGSGTNVEIYFGDRSLIQGTEGKTSEKFDYKGEPIIQIHNITAGEKTKDGIRINGERLKGKEFYTLAIFFPEKYAKNFIQKLKN